MNSEKTILPSLRNIEWRTLKIGTNEINQVLPHFPTNNITELNELIYAGAKLVCEKIGIPSKSMKEKSKPGWEIRLETQIKKSTKTGQNDKTKQRRWNMLEQKGKGNTRKNNSTTWGNKPIILAKEGGLKRYRPRLKQYRQDRTFQNNERKFCQQLGGDNTKNIPTTVSQRNRTILDENIATKKKKHNERAEWINNMTRELEGFEEGPKAEIHIDLLRTTLKKISNGKTPDHDGIHGCWFKKFTYIHGRLALEMNRCLQGAQVPDWMTKGKTILIQKDPSKGTALNNYRPIREENYSLLTSHGLFRGEQKECCKGYRSTAELLYIDQHILNESKTRRKNLAKA